METTMNVQTTGAKRGKLGWIILLAMSLLTLFSGLFFMIELPTMALSNIAEPAGLDESIFRQGAPSSFDVITLITRNYAIGFAALGLLALLVGLEGYRHGTRWAWLAMWVLVAAIAAMGINFLLIGGLYGATLGYLGMAALALIGQLLAGLGLASKRSG